MQRAWFVMQLLSCVIGKGNNLMISTKLLIFEVGKVGLGPRGKSLFGNNPLASLPHTSRVGE